MSRLTDHVTNKEDPKTMKPKKPKPTTGELIRAARIAKSKCMYKNLVDTGQRIGRGEKPETMYLQADLAEAIGMDQSQISAYERSKTEPELPTLRKLAKALEVPLIELIGE